MTTLNILTDLTQLGIHLASKGERLVVDAPKGALTPELREAIRAQKTAILDALCDHDWNRFPDPAKATEPFDQRHMDAIKAGHKVKVWSGVFGEWLWWVRGEPERMQLLGQGCKQPIYTLGELAVVPDMDTQELRNAHVLKRDTGAKIHPPTSEKS